MRRTISIMLGKGSVNHNSRKFKATNVDSQRSQFNISYCNVPIREVYHELFDDALQRYNAKQKRVDRHIDDYYEKIRTGKQEKLFYEVIFQVGNLENMASKSDEGELAAKILGEFMEDFQERNPYQKVFSAHLHMDEATPHLHVDFVPYTTDSKRGLDTRVSLKQALANQGFAGGSRGDTEWSQWVKSEKERLSQVMVRHGIEWEQLGTHDEHLSVVDFKKVQRVKEVSALEKTISDKQLSLVQLDEKTIIKQFELDECASKLDKAQTKLKTIKGKEKFVAANARKYDDDPKFELPEPKPLMSVRTYYEKVALPLVRKLKDAIRSILLHYFDKTQELREALDRANSQVKGLSKRLEKLELENERLRGIEKNFGLLKRGLGDDKVTKTILTMKDQAVSERGKPNVWESGR